MKQNIIELIELGIIIAIIIAVIAIPIIIKLIN